MSAPLSASNFITSSWPELIECLNNRIYSESSLASSFIKVTGPRRIMQWTISSIIFMVDIRLFINQQSYNINEAYMIWIFK